MQAGKFIVFASVAVTLFGLASSAGVIIYRAASPPKEVLKRIEETRKPISCQAHVLPIVVRRKASYLTVTINLRGLPSHVNTTSFKLDELYINIQNGPSANTATLKTKELWILETATQTLLARVPVNSSKTGYRAVKMRSVSASWLANNVQTGFLKVALPTNQRQLAKNLLKSNSYLVIYAYSSVGQIIMPTVPTPKCNFFEVTIRPQSTVNGAEFRTKICSPPEEITFPFNRTSFFDMGAALRKSLNDSPIPRTAAVLRNPKCCHATKAMSRFFAGFDPDESAIRVVELANIKITECGC